MGWTCICERIQKKKLIWAISGTKIWSDKVKTYYWFLVKIIWYHNCPSKCMSRKERNENEGERQSKGAAPRGEGMSLRTLKTQESPYRRLKPGLQYPLNTGNETYTLHQGHRCTLNTVMKSCSVCSWAWMGVGGWDPEPFQPPDMGWMWKSSSPKALDQKPVFLCI